MTNQSDVEEELISRIYRLVRVLKKAHKELRAIKYASFQGDVTSPLLEEMRNTIVEYEEDYK